MFRQIIQASALVATCFCFGCTTHQRDLSQPNAKTAWTIMVFMNAVNSLEPDSVANFAQMADVNYDKRVNVVVQYGRLSWTNAYRFHMKRGITADAASAVGTVPNADMGSPQVLGDFVHWAKDIYPADHYMLVIWDHGQGWRIMERATAERALRANGGGEFPRIAGRDSNYRSISVDERTHHQLYNSDIQTMLAAQGNVDVLGFDACLMSMIETGYAMRGGAKVMVGSEELEPGDGWNYLNWLSRVMAHPEIGEREMGASVVESYKAVYSPGREQNETLTAVDLSQIKAIADAISKLADRLNAAIANQSDKVKAARSASNVYAPNTFGDGRDYFQHIDLVHFCSLVTTKFQDKQTRDAAQAVIDAAKPCIIANYAGTARQGAFGSNGLAIYFPASGANYTSDPYAENGYEKNNADHPVDFVRDTSWTDFLHAYFVKFP